MSNINHSDTAPKSFHVLRMTKEGDIIQPEFKTLHTADLPAENTLTKVKYSSLNYKDGLAVAGLLGVLCGYPMTPRIDPTAAGLKVTASTRRPAEAEYLKSLGASEIIDRSEVMALRCPLKKERWVGVVDTVGVGFLSGFSKWVF